MVERIPGGTDAQPSEADVPVPSADESAVLVERARHLARPIETAAWEDVSAQFLGLDAGQARFAVPVAAVTTVLAPVRPTPIPRQPGWLAGAIGVDGQVVAVVEPDRFLGAETSDPMPNERRTVAVISARGRDVALLVDAVDRIEISERNEPDPLPVGTTDLVSRAVRGMVAGRYLLDADGFIAAIRDALGLIDDEGDRRPPTSG